MSRETALLTPLRQWGRVSGRIARRAFWPVAIVYLALSFGALVVNSLWMALAALALLWPVAAAAVRRLHDVGLSGWWLVLMLVPLLGLIPFVMLLWRRTYHPTRFPTINDSSLPGVLLALFCLTLIGIGAVSHSFQVAAGSMKPGLLPGDVALTWRFAYGGAPVSCFPFTCPAGRAGVPGRGDVVAFRSPKDSVRIARVIALPGEEVAITDGIPVINGTPAEQREDGIYSEEFMHSGPYGTLPRCTNGAVGLGARCNQLRRFEQLPGDEVSHRVLDLGVTQQDQMPVRTVPEGAIFVMGDNRDNASDSRMPASAGGVGMVPVDQVIGRAGRVLWSVNGAWWQIWKLRRNRILLKVE